MGLNGLEGRLEGLWGCRVFEAVLAIVELQLRDHVQSALEAGLIRYRCHSTTTQVQGSRLRVKREFLKQIL